MPFDMRVRHLKTSASTFARGVRILHCSQILLRVEQRKMGGKVSDLKATEINENCLQMNMEEKELTKGTFLSISACMTSSIYPGSVGQKIDPKEI